MRPPMIKSGNSRSMMLSCLQPHPENGCFGLLMRRAAGLKARAVAEVGFTRLSANLGERRGDAAIVGNAPPRLSLVSPSSTST
jgi:hypothetical protein